MSPRIRTSVLSLVAVSVLLVGPAAAQVDISAPRAVAGGASSVAIGDFDEDGFEDFAHSIDDRIDVYRNDGFEQFQRIATLEDSGSPVIAADWNDDGHLDLVTGKVAVYLGDGDGGFVLATERPIELEAEHLTIGFFDDDAHLDVIVTESSRDALFVVLGDGAGGLMEAQTAFSIRPGRAAIGDVNGDGFADLVVPNRRGGASNDSFTSLGLLRGDGTGNVTGLGFPLYPMANPVDPKIADLDNDGNADFVFISSVGLSASFGRGDGTFLPRVRVAVTTGCTFVLEDFNGDGILDVAVGGSEDGFQIDVRLGTGSGEFGVPTYYMLHDGEAVESITAGDVNGDGNVDLISGTSRAATALTVLLGNGDGTFQTPPTTTSLPQRVRPFVPRGVVLGHFDDDAHLDAAVASASTALYVVFGDGSGTFALTETFALNINHLATVDMNDDALPDLVAASPEGLVHVLLGTMSGAFAPMPGVAAATTCRAIAFGDFDGDTFLDAATANGERPDGVEVSILLGDGAGGLTLDAVYGAGQDPNYIVSSDFDVDGLVDLAVTNDSSVTLFTNGGSGTFRTYQEIPTDNIAYDVVLVDLDDDGDLDAAVSGDDGTTSILRGNGTGQFSIVQQVATGDESRTIEALDVDEDGRIDLLVQNEGSEDVTVHRNGGPGVGFEAAARYAVSSESWRLHIGDLTNDGVPDAVTAGRRRVVILAGDGNGGFRDLDPPISTGYFDVPRKGDIDANGTLDVVAGSSELVFLANDGLGTFTRTDYPTASSVDDIVIAALDGDAFLDVAAACEDSNRVTVYSGTATGLDSRRDLVTGSEPSGVAAGDFDEDGNTDLVVANAGDDTASLFFGDGTGDFPKTDLITEDLYRPFGVAVGNFDDLLDPDGHLDLAFSLREPLSVAVMTGDGTGSFAEAVAFPVNNASHNIVTWDFDGDGHLDIAIGGGSPVSKIYFGSGYGTFPDSITLPVNGRYLALADVNRDGRDDLIMTHFRSYHDDPGSLHVVLANDSRDPTSIFTFSVGSPGSVVGGNFDDERDVDVIISGFSSDPTMRLLRNRNFDPLRCRAGNVNDLVGERAETLTVNESIGAPSREVAVDSTDSIRVALERAPTPAAGSKYYVGVWAGAPTKDTTARVPALIGYSCFQMIRNQPDYLMPIEVANTLRPTDPRLDPATGTATGNPVPSEVLVIPAGLAPGTVLTVQGILGDGGTTAAKSVSLTNAVVVTVE